MGVKNAAQKPVRVVLTGIAKQLSKVFEQLLQRLLPSGAGSPPPLLAPIRFGSENEKRLWVANDGTVMVKASPNQTFANYLKTTNLSDADKKKAEKLAQQISATAKTLAASTKTKQDRASLKQANELKTKIEGLEKELAKLLGVSADCAKVLVHNASTGCNPCDEMKIGIDSTGRIFDERKWIPKTVNHVFDDRGPKFTTTGGQYISVDVVDYVIARLNSTSGGSGPDSDAWAWVQCLVGVKKDDAGHVIGDSLGGSGKLKDGNLFPQNYRRNRGVQSTFEKTVIKPAVTAGKNVCVLIKLSYVNTHKDFPGRPTKVLYSVWIDGKQENRVYDNNFPAEWETPIPGKPNYCSEASK